MLCVAHQAKWLQVHEQLQGESWLSQEVVTREQVRRLAAECGVTSDGPASEDPGGLEALLVRLNELGSIVYFPEERLRDKIVVDPARLIEKVRRCFASFLVSL